MLIHRSPSRRTKKDQRPGGSAVGLTHLQWQYTVSGLPGPLPPMVPAAETTPDPPRRNDPGLSVAACRRPGFDHPDVEPGRRQAATLGKSLCLGHDAGDSVRGNAKAKLPGPPARTLPLGKPAWRPRSASAVGSDVLSCATAPSALAGVLRFDFLPERFMGNAASFSKPLPGGFQNRLQLGGVTHKQPLNIVLALGPEQDRYRFALPGHD